MSGPEDPWAELRRFTPARIALGRAGHAVPTREVLRFGLAHARARDAVHAALDVAPLEDAIRALGFATCRAESAAPDRATYLARPDLGRRLALGSRDVVGGAAREACDLAIVVADGLSAPAAGRHAAPLLAALRPLATVAGWSLGPVTIATQARVALGDEIGAALRARAVLILIGERPGLSAPDSLGAYLTLAPRVGRTDAERNCLSNIRPGGMTSEEAAHRIAWLVAEAMRRGVTGVALKDESDRLILDGPLQAPARLKDA